MFDQHLSSTIRSLKSRDYFFTDRSLMPLWRFRSSKASSPNLPLPGGFSHDQTRSTRLPLLQAPFNPILLSILELFLPLKQTVVSGPRPCRADSFRARFPCHSPASSDLVGIYLSFCISLNDQGIHPSRDIEGLPTTNRFWSLPSPVIG